MTDVKCYLKIIDKCEELINYYDMLIMLFNEHKSLTSKSLESILEFEDYNNVLSYTVNKSFFINKIMLAKDLKERCTKKMNDICQHSFIQDVIEVGPERSENITYCEICKFTK